MKSAHLLFFGIAFILCSCGSNDGITSEYLKIKTTISFDSEVYDFGEILQGQEVSHSFTFTNTGNENLVISLVEGTCGCFIPMGWPKTPIAPGGTGNIDVVFKSAGKFGEQNRAVAVIANTSPATNVLKIEGTVIAPNNN